MSLISNFTLAGSGIVTSFTVNTRQYHVEGTATGYPGNPGYQLWNKEVRTVEVREWVGLTYACANGQAVANAQPAQVGYESRSYTYAATELLRPTRSYKLTRTYEVVSDYPTSNSMFAIPTITPNGGGPFTYPKLVAVAVGSGGRYTPNAVAHREEGGIVSVAALPGNIYVEIPGLLELWAVDTRITNYLDVSSGYRRVTFT